METITITTEQLEELKANLKEEIKSEIQFEAKKTRWNAPMVEVERKYHNELVKINFGSTWQTIRNMTAYYLGYPNSMKIPPEKMEEAAKIAEDLCKKVIESFEKRKREELSKTVPFSEVVRKMKK